MEKETKVTKINAMGIANLLRVNKNTRSYIVFKYKNEAMSEKDWKLKLKKDGLTF